MSMPVLMKGAEATAGSMPIRFKVRGTKVPIKAEINILQRRVMATRMLRAILWSQRKATAQRTTAQHTPVISPTQDSRQTLRNILEESTWPVEIPRTVTVELWVPALPPKPKRRGIK